MEARIPYDEEALTSYGWYSHFVLSENGGQQWVNYHTHGLPELYGHLDFQLVLPIDRATLHALATKLVKRVQKGERFAPSVRVSGILDNHDIFLAKTMETRSIDRPVLLAILPDKDGNLDEAHLTGVFAAQFKELPN